MIVRIERDGTTKVQFSKEEEERYFAGDQVMAERLGQLYEAAKGAIHGCKWVEAETESMRLFEDVKMTRYVIDEMRAVKGAPRSRSTAKNNNPEPAAASA